MPDRLTCIVPFCRRTRAADREPRYAEWCCGDHWRLVPMKLRRFRTRCLKAVRRACEHRAAVYDQADAAAAKLNGLMHQDDLASCRAADGEAGHAMIRASRAWERCKRAAIEAAGGIR